MQRKFNNFGQEIFPSRDYAGRFYWYSHCLECGKKVTVTLHMKNKIYCDRCKAELKRLEQEAKEIDDIIKYEIRFNQGVELLETKVNHIEKYQKAIALAKTKVRRYGSANEVLAAIVMMHFGYKVLAQQKIGKYRADFLLPDQKLIVEIDGKPFHSDKKKEIERDNAMTLTMGLGWKVLHIPTDLLRKKPLALNDAIKENRI